MRKEIHALRTLRIGKVWSTRYPDMACYQIRVPHYWTAFSYTWYHLYFFWEVSSFPVKNKSHSQPKNHYGSGEEHFTFLGSTSVASCFMIYYHSWNQYYALNLKGYALKIPEIFLSVLYILQYTEGTRRILKWERKGNKPNSCIEKDGFWKQVYFVNIIRGCGSLRYFLSLLWETKVQSLGKVTTETFMHRVSRRFLMIFSLVST